MCATHDAKEKRRTMHINDVQTWKLLKTNNKMKNVLEILPFFATHKFVNWILYIFVFSSVSLQDVLEEYAERVKRRGTVLKIDPAFLRWTPFVPPAPSATSS